MNAQVTEMGKSQVVSVSHLQNLNRIFSKTKTGPVLPSIVNGCPANSE